MKLTDAIGRRLSQTLQSSRVHRRRARRHFGNTDLGRRRPSTAVRRQLPPHYYEQNPTSRCVKIKARITSKQTAGAPYVLIFPPYRPAPGERTQVLQLWVSDRARAGAGKLDVSRHVRIVAQARKRYRRNHQQPPSYGLLRPSRVRVHLEREQVGRPLSRDRRKTSHALRERWRLQRLAIAIDGTFAAARLPTSAQHDAEKARIRFRFRGHNRSGPSSHCGDHVTIFGSLDHLQRGPQCRLARLLRLSVAEFRHSGYFTIYPTTCSFFGRIGVDCRPSP